MANKLLIAEITKCGQCPFCLANMQCQLCDGRDILDVELPVPLWCPLTDFEGPSILIQQYGELVPREVFPFNDSVFDFLVY